MDSTKLVSMQGSACCASCGPVSSNEASCDQETGCACCAPDPKKERAADQEHSCACCSHDHDHEHGPANQRLELIKMGISAVLFAIGMVADERWPPCSDRKQRFLSLSFS